GQTGTIYNAFNLFTGEEVAVKVDVPDETLQQPYALPYEVKIYAVLRDHRGFPSVCWHGDERNCSVMVMDKLGPTLDHLRHFCRGRFSFKTICMLALQMLMRIEFAHSRGILIRDIKPDNFAVGLGESRNVVYLFDFGVSKLYMDPITRKHIPFRDGRSEVGTPRYVSHNAQFGRELSRRDDIETFGITLLFLFHGRLPWQGVYAPDMKAKVRRIGEMKAGEALRRLLLQSPPEFTALIDHSRNLAFEDKPNYNFIRGLFLQRMQKEGWENDGLFDWVDPKLSDRGTLIPEEYVWAEEIATNTSMNVMRPSWGYSS
ncbi:hypothetical protein CERSUDRAFT_54453, partial [Gelatoporia subvermispora B]